MAEKKGFSEASRNATASVINGVFARKNEEKQEENKKKNIRS